MSPDEIRALFPGASRTVYLNAAAQSLLPSTVADRMASVVRRQTRRGILALGEDFAALEATRAAAARLLGCDAGSVAFVGNTAEGISRVAEGLDWRPGDEVVLADLEFPANVYPWAAQRERGVRLRFVPSSAGRVDPGRYLDALGPRTRVLAVSHVQFATGYRIDLETLGRACRERDVLLVVDAIQSLGVVPLDPSAANVGALAVDGRKWLLGPAGCGLLYVSPQWIDRIRPLAVGTQSTRHPERVMQYRDWLDADGQLDLLQAGRLAAGARRFESGFPNLVGIAGLGAALALGERIGRPAIHRRIAELVQRTVELLQAAGLEVHGPTHGGERAGIVSFEVPGSAERLFRRLDREGVSLSARDGRLRISPHVYNSETDLEHAVTRVATLAAGAASTR